MDHDEIRVPRFLRTVEVDLADQTLRSSPRALPSCTIGGAFAGLVAAIVARDPEGWQLVVAGVSAALAMLFFGLPFLERGVLDVCFRTSTITIDGSRPMRFTDVDVGPALRGGGIALTVLARGQRIEIFELGAEDDVHLRVLADGLVQRDRRPFHARSLAIGLRDSGLQAVVVWVAIFGPVLIAAVLVALGFDGELPELGFD